MKAARIVFAWHGSGYAAFPPIARGGAIVIHDWFGLHNHVKRLCERLANQDFMAVAPDLYGRYPLRHPEEAQRFLRMLWDERARFLIRASADALRSHVGTAPIGAIGFSIGGWYALEVARSLELDAVVAYYAAMKPNEYRPVPCPVQLHLAQSDAWDPPDTPQRFTAWLKDSGGHVETHIYPNAGHSFANEDMEDAFNRQAAEAAWGRTLEFLVSRLRPE